MWIGSVRFFSRPNAARLCAALLTACSFVSACGGGGDSPGSAPADADAKSAQATGHHPKKKPDPSGMEVGKVVVTHRGSDLQDEWFSKGGFMQINVRAYHDSDGDGVGDLNGVTQKLDYLKALGVTGIWLMPINRTDDHDSGYIVSDHRDIEIEYGTLQDFKRLLKEAHKREIGVIIDYVPNHSADTNPLFVNAQSSPTARYRDWFVWQPTRPEGWAPNAAGNDSWNAVSDGSHYYARFDAHMPDFNLRNPEVVEYHKNNLRFWLNLGVDGFRFDAVDTLIENGPGQELAQPENYQLMNEFRAVVEDYRNRYIVCESPSAPSYAASHNACGSAFAFEFNGYVRDAARGTADLGIFQGWLMNRPLARAGQFLANHDRFAGIRLMDEFAGDEQSYRSAAATLLTLPGVPFLYYGEEVGMATMDLSDLFSYASDWNQRGPMSWGAQPTVTDNTALGPFASFDYMRPAPNIATHNVAAEWSDPSSLLNFYKRLLHLRKDSSALQQGGFHVASLGAASLVYERRTARESVVVALNYGATDDSAMLSGLPANERYNATGVSPSIVRSFRTNGSGTTDQALAMPARSVQIFRTRLSNQEVYPVAMFVRGEMNDWGTRDAMRYDAQHKRYESVIELSEAKTYQFKIADGGWWPYAFGRAAGRSDGSPTASGRLDFGNGSAHELELTGWYWEGESNLQITVLKPGRYRFKLEVDNPFAPKLTVRKV